MKTLAITLIALFVISTVGAAQAVTFKMSQMYGNEVTAYGGERIYIINDDHLPHTVTEQNNLFDTTILYPGQLTDLELSQDGTYQFYDKTNTNRTGIIHIKSTEQGTTKVETWPASIQAGETVHIVGSYYQQKQQAYIQIKNPDGTTLESLQAFPTSDGRVEIPFTTTRTSQNGIYQVIDESKGLITSFVVSGGVTADNPTVPAPITNSTQPTNSTTPNNPGNSNTSNPLPTIPTNTDKQTLITWLKQMIAYYQQLLAIVEAS